MDQHYNVDLYVIANHVHWRLVLSLQWHRWIISVARTNHATILTEIYHAQQQQTLGKNSVNSTGRNEGLELEFAVLGSAGLAKGRVGYSISSIVLVCILNQPFKNSSIQSAGMLTDAGMLTRLAGHEAEARKNEAEAEWFGLEALTSVVLCWLCPWWQPKKHLVSTHVLFEDLLKVAQQGQHRRGRRTVVRGMIQLLLLVACYL